METNKLIELPAEDQLDILKLKTKRCVEAYSNFNSYLLKDPKELADYLENLVDGLIDDLVVPERFKVRELEKTIEQLKRQIK